MPIDQTMRGLALEIDAATNPTPEAQPLLEYRFIDLASTQTILARIKGIPRSSGGGQLGFETNAGADATTQRMLIDNQGNVGIGTENPGARLEVGGDVKFNGPLNVEGPITVSGVAKIGGDLSVTGKLTADNFAGNGAGLSNVTPADNSVTSAKLAQDSASLSKLSGGEMVIRAGNVGIGTANDPQNRLHVGPGTSSILPTRVNAVVASNAPDAGIAIAQNSGVNVLVQASGAGGYFGTTSNHPLVLRTNDLDRVVVDTSGDLTVTGITKTKKLRLGNKWLVSGEGDAHANDDWLRLFNIQGTGYFGGFAAGKLYSGTTTFTQKLQLGNKWLLSGEGDAHANDDWLRLFNIQGTGYFGGFAAGRLWTIGGTVQGSDLRLKTNVSSLVHMVDKLVALRGVRFKWRNAREDDSYRIGLIAQEVEGVLPEVIETGPDGMKGINESGLVAAIVTAIKEQQAELRALRAEIALFRAT
jgi:Chaperone of endosialidase